MFYSEQLVEEIVSRIAEGEILTAICKSEDMPNIRNVLRWLAKHEDFRRRYDRAREIRADTWGEDIVEISDDASRDWIDREKPTARQIVSWITNTSAGLSFG